MAYGNIKSGTYTPFGGLYFANKAFSSLSIGILVPSPTLIFHNPLKSEHDGRIYTCLPQNYIEPL